VADDVKGKAADVKDLAVRKGKEVHSVASEKASQVRRTPSSGASESAVESTTECGGEHHSS
jgi:hypothetical protein